MEPLDSSWYNVSNNKDNAYLEIIVDDGLLGLFHAYCPQMSGEIYGNSKENAKKKLEIKLVEIANKFKDVKSELEEKIAEYNEIIAKTVNESEKSKLIFELNRVITKLSEDFKPRLVYVERILNNGVKFDKEYSVKAPIIMSRPPQLFV